MLEGSQNNHSVRTGHHFQPTVGARTRTTSVSVRKELELLISGCTVDDLVPLDYYHQPSQLNSLAAGMGKIMDMIRVISSAITAVGYDAATGRMKITFKQGRTYDFCHVPSQVHQGLMNAVSKGSYFDKVIKDRYQC